MDELIRLFNQNDIQYLVIGGQTMRLEGMPRFSMDWDIFIPPHNHENIDKINQLLNEELDIPLLPLGRKGENFIQTYQTRWGIVQFHLGVPGLPSFAETEQNAVYHKNENGTPVRCIHWRDLLSSKIAANRPVDHDDISFLKIKYAAEISP